VSEAGPRPAEFARSLVAAVDASDGRRRRRKRNTEPDKLGLEIKRDLLARAVEADPDPEGFEGWLLAQALGAAASGPVRALCAEILDEYRLARGDATFAAWLAAGAPSEDAFPEDGRRARLHGGPGRKAPGS
jgi:hypothetical protein